MLQPNTKNEPAPPPHTPPRRLLIAEDPAVLHGGQGQPLTDEAGLLFLQERAGHIRQQPDDLAMAIDHRVALVFSLGHALADETHHPEDAQNVVHMLVGDENGADLPPIYIRLLQPQQKGVSAAPVHQEIPPVLLQDKAGVIARRDHGVAGSQHGEFDVASAAFLWGVACYLCVKWG